MILIAYCYAKMNISFCADAQYTRVMEHFNQMDAENIENSSGAWQIYGKYLFNMHNYRPLLVAHGIRAPNAIGAYLHAL